MVLGCPTPRRAPLISRVTILEFSQGFPMSASPPAPPASDFQIGTRIVPRRVGRDSRRRTTALDRDQPPVEAPCSTKTADSNLEVFPTTPTIAAPARMRDPFARLTDQVLMSSVESVRHSRGREGCTGDLGITADPARERSPCAVILLRYIEPRYPEGHVPGNYTEASTHDD